MRILASFFTAIILALFVVSSSVYANESLKNSKKIQWYPAFHLASNGNSMKEPSGFVYFQGQYHLFFEDSIDNNDPKKMQWGHSVSPDMLNWRYLNAALKPSTEYDKDGINSGSAIVDQDMLYLLYTGREVKKVNEKTEIHETQNLAMSKDGKNFGKSANNPVIKMAPHYSYLDFSSSTFSDPFVWKQSDRYYALVGSQYEKTKDGAVLLFKSKDLRNWVFINVTAVGRNGEMGQVWESPNFVHIGQDDVLMISPKGIKPQGKAFLNKNQSGWFVGKLDYDTGKFKQKGAFGLFDKGFDFYAPSVIKTPDNRVVMIGMLGMEGSSLPEKSEGWTGMMSIPREMKIVNNRVVTTPVSEIKSLRDSGVIYKNQTLNGDRDFSNIKGDVYELNVDADLTNAKTFSIHLRSSASQETVLSYDKDTKVLKLNRDKSGSGLKGEREAHLNLENNNLLKLRIFVDKSSIEIFANDGQVVMSSRIYPDKSAQGIKFVSNGQVKLNNLEFYKLKSIHD